MTHLVCKVMIVDDEPIILRSLRIAIPWTELGMELVGQARNGEEALEVVDRTKPDIIISDIRMPSIDGITLMRIIMERFPDTLFIILSGYGEFEYAREAIRHGAFNYLLKPIDHDELQEVVILAKQRIQEQRKSVYEQESLRRSVQSWSSAVRERMFSGIIEGTDHPEHKQQYWLDEWEIDGPYYMGLVNLDDYETTAASWDSEERRLWFFAIGNILQEYLTTHDCTISFPFHNGEWLFIMSNRDLDQMRNLSQELIATVKHCTKLSVSVAISRQFSEISSLQFSYQSCRNALCRRFTAGKETVYVDGDERYDLVKSGPTADIAYPIQQEKKLAEGLRTLDWSRFDHELAELARLLTAARAPHHIVRHMLVQLVTILHRQLDAFHTVRNKGLEPLLHDITTLSTLEDMMDVIRERFFIWVREALDREHRLDAATVVHKVYEYVENHYHHDISIDEVAEHVSLSCSHFCVLFKQETGYTFLEYLTKYRIDKACSILRNSEVKVFQIAPLVGYQDPRYFTQVFKKVIGKTPSEYRLSQLSS